MSKPIIELYEYQIVGQPNDTSTISKFGNIEDSPTDSFTNSLSDCSRISIEGLEDSKLPDLLRTSCDPIRSKKSIKGGAPMKKYKFYDINNLYDNYNFLLSKNTEVLEEMTDSSKQSFNDNMDIIIKQQLELLNKSLIKTPNTELEKFKTEIENLDKINDDDKIFDNITKKTEETALIQKINIKPENKIIMMGDFHGSFHAFFRLLCRFHRYGILNLETYVINEPYKIIFLGDILDRGRYALDIINIIFKLIAINNNDITNQKIFYNRGNHEVYSQYNNDGGFDEMVKKLSIETQDHVATIKLLIKFNKTLSLLPSALLVTCNNTKFWCCHGGFPQIYSDKKIPDDDIIFIDNNIPKHMRGATDIRWSDFGYHPYSEIFGNPRGPGIITYSYMGTMRFLNNNNINFIIRCHQDSYGNSFYFKNSDSDTINVINNPILRRIPNFLYYNDTSAPHIMRVSGPIARIVADKTDIKTIKPKMPEIFPILTISTNMDAGRALTADSFALLRFDIDRADITDFTQNTLSILNNINSLILGKSNINKGNILLNILNITNDIYKLINDETIMSLIHLYLYHDNYIKTYPTNQYINDFEKNNFMTISANIYEIFYDMYDILDYYYKKTTNLISKFDVYEKTAKNGLFIGNLKKKFSEKLSSITNNMSILDNNFGDTALLSIDKLEKAIKLNVYEDETDDKKLLPKPKLMVLLDNLNAKIIEYDNIEK